MTRNAAAFDPLELRLPPGGVVPVPRDSVPLFRVADAEVDALLHLPEARDTFRVYGAGIAVAVLDTGLRLTHRDFVGRIPASWNFTDEGNEADANDRNGHGTNVAGIIAAAGRHAPMGVAPACSVIPLRVLRADGGGSFEWTLRALRWVQENATKYQIGVASLSLGNAGNYRRFEDAVSNAATRDLFERIRTCIRALANAGVVVVVAAGNEYFRWQTEGMSFPAVIPECISVGAVYDSVIAGPISYRSGARATTTGPDRITPFSQRLGPSGGSDAETDVFAPGAPITSAGFDADDGLSVQSGTSQATPVVSGLVVLLQEYFVANAGRRPTFDEIHRCLRDGTQTIIDGDDENDNVTHTNGQYRRTSPLKMLNAAKSMLQPSVTADPVVLSMRELSARFVRNLTVEA